MRKNLNKYSRRDQKQDYELASLKLLRSGQEQEKSFRILNFASALILILLLSSCGNNYTPEQKAYIKKIEDYRTEKNDEMKCSLRSSKIILPILIEKALVGLEGYGGGHEHACGLNIKSHHFEEFVRRFREMI